MNNFIDIKPMVFDKDTLKEQANENNKLAIYLLARSYDSAENNINQDLSKAVYWYQKGALLNDPKCIYGLGACYFFGDGVEENKEKAYDLFIEAYPLLLKEIEDLKDNEKVQSYSKFCLGAYYYFGFGDIKQDKNKAFELIYECAQLGHMAAIYDLGANFYYNGVGTDKDINLANKYLNLAANNNYERAIKLLEERNNQKKLSK